MARQQLKESAVSFGPAGGLVGVVCEPRQRMADPAGTAAIILNSGMVHRVGPNRLHVRLARALAAKGATTLRFDLSGVGDSVAGTELLSTPERWVSDTRLAISMLADRLGAERFVLIGNCSGASIACLTAHADSRVSAVVAVNLFLPHPVRYFVRLLLTNPKFWRRMATFNIDPRRLIDSLPFIHRHHAGDGPVDLLEGLTGLAGRGVDMLLVASEWDPSHDHFHRLHRELDRPPLSQRITIAGVPRADHLFNTLADQEHLIRLVEGWWSGTILQPQREAAQ